MDDLNLKDESGNFVHHDVPPEVQQAQKVFSEVPDVFELRGAMRFRVGDPLVGLLQCMRSGTRFPDEIWNSFVSRCAVDSSPGVPDERMLEENFRSGYCVSIYWNVLTRMMNRRALLDATRVKVPLVLMQCADECGEMDPDAVLRFLCSPNPYKTGQMHGVFPCHVGMEVRLLAKLDGEQGLVQDTVATILDFEFDPTDRVGYCNAGAGELFSPCHLLAGLYLSVRGYRGNKNWKNYTSVFEGRGYFPNESRSSLGVCGSCNPSRPK